MSEEKQLKCVYDPLTELMAYYADKKAEKKETVDRSNLAVEDILKNRIIDGDKIGLEADLDNALKEYSALQIINDILLDGMKVVGELFGSGQMQLPFVLQSAECMKAAVKYLEPYMEKVEGESSKGVIVLATVKGDVHDIGKNLVDIILTNNGYKVINLGIKCPLENMLSSYEDNKADAIGMSGLLVKSTAIMKENLEQMNERNMEVPVILGGAALTKRFVEGDLRAMYHGDVYYANDAFDGLKFMQEIVEYKKRGERPDLKVYVDPRSKKEEPAEEAVTEEPIADDASKTGGSLDTSLHLQNVQQDDADYKREVKYNKDRQVYLIRSDVSTDVPVPVPPFFGSKIVENIPIDKVYEYINEVALFRGNWNVYKDRTKSDEAYEELLQREIYPKFNELKLKAKREKTLIPKVIYGYFPAQSDGNELVIYKPKGLTGDALYDVWKDFEPQELNNNITRGDLEVWQKFDFPRQKDKKHLCISDYYKPVESGLLDVAAFQIVTVGKQATDYAQQLYVDNKYQEYLYFHGLSVETAEALAEYWHKIIRKELGIDSKDSADIKKLFQQGYQGSRYSFGYPACPNLEDNKQLFEMLNPLRIGVELTEEWQMVPEQSTNAIVVHHPEAKYFFVR
jgi:5-methyltetrahydrofolate--homocysteine methyltransferase